MHSYVNEDAMFERLESLRREVESSRLTAEGLRGWVKLVRNVGARAWLLGGLAMRRPPRRRPVATHRAYDETTASGAA
jgi:hypothetical protein